ncbi:MAG: aminoglycoside phosphotransferase family protein [Clostridia bacterium]|nr:aminoglycoside phosphotransferase family protein [Clostridia bacterium]
MDLNAILKEYAFNGTVSGCSPLGEGHINETMLLNFATEYGTEKYVLQRINDKLFDVEKLMRNITLVTDFIRKKTAQRGGDPDKECLTVVRTAKGDSYVKTADGYYRIYRFINGVSYQVVEKAEDFYKCAKAFGAFTESLAEFDATLLYEVIPQFHDTEKRFRDFMNSLEEDASGRAKKVRKEIDFVLKRSDYCSRVVSLLKNGEIPVRVTHNDTKLNNVMFDKTTGECVAVVDLDTVMPGSLCYDFGDAIRFGCNTSTEDDKYLSRVNFNIDLFRAFAEGYLSEIRGITDTELKNLAFSAILMTYECGMRFLADHIDGDTYFRISREGQNLDRARTQFKLIEDMEKVLPEMEKIVINAKNSV